MTVSEIAAAGRAAFTKWYNEIHVPAIVAHPAILSGARYEEVGTHLRFLAIYGMASAEVSSSPELRRVGSWGPVERHLRGVWSGRYRLTWNSGEPDESAEPASFLRLTWLDPKSDRAAAEFEEWYERERLPACLEGAGVIGAARYECLNGEPRLLTVYELSDPDAVGDLDAPGAFDLLKSGRSYVYRRVFSRPGRASDQSMVDDQTSHDRVGEGTRS